MHKILVQLILSGECKSQINMQDKNPSKDFFLTTNIFLPILKWEKKPKKIQLRITKIKARLAFILNNYQLIFLGARALVSK